MDAPLLYTLPVVGALTLIAQPFLGRSDVLKIALISCSAAVYAAVAAAASQSDRRVAGSDGPWSTHRPAAVAVRCALTALWTMLCVRWRLPCLRFNTDKRSYMWIRWTPIAVLAAGCVLAAPGRPPVLWACAAAAVLWYGAGNYCARTLVPSSVAVAAPTAYLCWTAGTSPGEALAVAATNALVVLAALAYDKSRGMMDAYSSHFPARFGLDRRFLGQLARAFFTAEYAVPALVVDDIRTCDDVVNASSKTFHVTRHFLHASVRLDLTIVYAYIRFVDDFIDNEPDLAKKKRNYDMIKQFTDEMFADRNSDRDVLPRPRVPNIDWARYRSDMTDGQIAIFRAMSRIGFYMSRRPFDKMLVAFLWDIERRMIDNEHHLRSYANNASGSIGEIMGYSIMYRCDHESYDFVERRKIVKKMRIVGQVLQYMNMARDIVVDSETSGRCYLPLDYLDDKEKELKILCIDKTPRDLGNQKLKNYSLKLIKFSDSQQLNLDDVMKCLPYDIRGWFLTIIQSYLDLKSVIISSPTFPRKASLSKWKLIRTGFYNIYLKTI